jgi:hypothetical protein
MASLQFLLKHTSTNPANTWSSYSGRKEAIQKLKTYLSSGSVFIAGVLANGNNGDVGYQYSIPHWVVITGITDFDFDDGTDVRWWSDTNKSWINDYSADTNWVRIYNPFNNQTEYLMWSDFSKAWVNDGNSLIRIDRKIGVTRPPQRRCQ